MFLVFLANKGMVYTNYETRDKTVNIDYIVDALRKFGKALHQLWPDLLPCEVVFPLGQYPSSPRPKIAGVPGQNKPPAGSQPPFIS
jgi:hypothetical protein